MLVMGFSPLEESGTSFRRMASPEGRGCREAAGEGCRSNDFTLHLAFWATLFLRERPFAEHFSQIGQHWSSTAPTEGHSHFPLDKAASVSNGKQAR